MSGKGIEVSGKGVQCQTVSGTLIEVSDKVSGSVRQGYILCKKGVRQEYRGVGEFEYRGVKARV